MYNNNPFETGIDFRTFPEVNVKLVQAGQRASRNPIYNLDSALNYVSDLLADSLTEQVVAIMLDRGRRPLCYMKAGIGGSKNVTFSVPQIVRCAILCDADALILVHNHANIETPYPSAKDIATTNEIYRILETLHIQLFDSVIVNQDKSLYSFFKEQCGCFAPKVQQQTQAASPSQQAPFDPNYIKLTPWKGGIPNEHTQRIQLQISVTGAEII